MDVDARSRLDLAAPDGPITAIAPTDTMCEPGREDSYFAVGRAALDVCTRILGGVRPARVIDFPSGYGRALRWFRHAWPDAEITAIETDAAALRFVETTFGARPLPSNASLDLVLPGNADLIFSGSLLTHFDEWQWDAFLRLCIDALAPGGTLVFTTHGRVTGVQLRADAGMFGPLIDGTRLLADYASGGFAYQPYSVDYPEFGVSLSSPEWIFRKLQALPFGRVVAFEEQGWGQDVVAIRRNPWPLVPV